MELEQRTQLARKGIQVWLAEPPFSRPSQAKPTWFRLAGRRVRLRQRSISGPEKH
jgi:hypothetical protein